jgi:hypothetical protein
MTFDLGARALCLQNAGQAEVPGFLVSTAANPTAVLAQKKSVLRVPDTQGSLPEH